MTKGRRHRIRAKILGRCRVEFTGYEIDGVPDACHIWEGPCSGDGRGGGYARMSLDGGTVAVHRASWINENGVIPPRKQLDHLCRQRLCVKESHLELVTQKKNCKRRDSARKEERDE